MPKLTLRLGVATLELTNTYYIIVTLLTLTILSGVFYYEKSNHDRLVAVEEKLDKEIESHAIDILIDYLADKETITEEDQKFIDHLIERSLKIRDSR